MGSQALCGYVQVYYVYGFMLLVFIILAIVTVCVTIVGTYFLLNAENYHWQWTSFSAAASTSLCASLPSITACVPLDAFEGQQLLPQCRSPHTAIERPQECAKGQLG